MPAALTNVQRVEKDLASRPELQDTGGAATALTLAKILDSPTAPETTLLGAAKELHAVLKTLGILNPGTAEPTGDGDGGDRMDKMRERFERRRADAAQG